MKTIAYLCLKALIVSALFISGCTQNGEFTLLGANQKSLDDYQGRWVVINFWAEWCAPCLEEIPELNRLAKEGLEQDISVIGVSYDPLKLEELKTIVDKWKFEYPVMLSEPVPILPFALPSQLPTNYLVDPQGEVVKKLVGKQDYQSLMDAIKQAQDNYSKKI